MARATAADVTAIKDTTVSDAVILSAYIAAATLVVDGIAAGCGSDLSDDKLKQGEIWYSAHLLSVSLSPVIVKEKFEGWSQENQVGGTDGTGVMSTIYGQTANTLLNGCLVEEDKRTPQMAFA